MQVNLIKIVGKHEMDKLTSKKKLLERLGFPDKKKQAAIYDLASAHCKRALSDVVNAVQTTKQLNDTLLSTENNIVSSYVGKHKLVEMIEAARRQLRVEDDNLVAASKEL